MDEKHDKHADCTTIVLRAIKLNFDLVAICLIVLAAGILWYAIFTASVSTVADVFSTLVTALCGFAALWITVALKIRTPPGRVAQKKIQQLQRPDKDLDEWGQTIIR
jgi:hypothetical protein